MGGSSGNQMPSCTSPLTLLVTDASNGNGMSGCIVKVYDNTDSRRVIKTLPTDSRGMASFDTSLTDLKFVVSKKGVTDVEEWSEVTEVKNRLEYCTDPTRCVIKFTLTRK